MDFDYIDIHSHLYFPDFDADREEEIEKLKKENIAAITVGADFESSEKAIDLAKNHPHLFATVGEHPYDVTTDSVFNERFFELAKQPKVVAIGECGLDYFRSKDDPTKKVQKKIFESHIELALKSNLPLMLHIRPSKGTQDAYIDGLNILESYAKKYGEKLRGNSHFFVGSPEVLRRFLAIGFTVSFTGVLTFTSDYDELVRETPLHSLMSETDAPLVAPVPYRGKRNSPLYVPEVVKAISRIRGEDFETVRQILVDNALRHFNLAKILQ